MEQNNRTNKKINISLNLHWVITALLVIIAVMLLIWQPWAEKNLDGQTITVTGETTLKAVPDKFTFYPTYQFENSNKADALAALAKKSEEIVAKLKELGVSENQIITSSGGYESSPVTRDSANETTYTLQLTVIVDNQELAQKVQDYLVTTTPTGSVSPQPSFSEDKQKELEAQARELATVDARSKAEATAKSVGFELGKVKSVSDGSSFWVTTSETRDSMATSLGTKPSSLSLHPGENELPYSVNIVYYIH